MNLIKLNKRFYFKYVLIFFKKYKKKHQFTHLSRSKIHNKQSQSIHNYIYKFIIIIKILKLFKLYYLF